MTYHSIFYFEPVSEDPRDKERKGRSSMEYPEGEGKEANVDPNDGFRPFDDDPRTRRSGSQNKEDARDHDHAHPSDEERVPGFDSLPSQSGDSQPYRYAGRKKLRQLEREDSLKRRFILDAVCVAHLSHGHFYTNPKIQCSRRPYNAIKDPNTGKYFENEHVIRLLNKTGQLDYKEPRYRGVAIEGPYEERAYNIAEFHYFLDKRNRHGCGRAYETYKGIDLYYDLPKPTTRRTFKDAVETWKRLVIPGYRNGPKDKILGMQYEDEQPPSKVSEMSQLDSLPIMSNKNCFFKRA